jgi:ATP/maltotriose-dependent transcriptional regulator MalT/two-component SAPR family response regulator
MLDSVLRHAITPPTFDPTKLHRERLVDAIHANIPRRLIAIAAPPGYGKTTLLADFNAHTELPVCWIRLTEADSDLMRLVSVLAASLQRRFRRLRDQPPLASLTGSTPAGIARAFADAIDERVGEAFVIVLDDVHLVNRSRPVLAFLDSFLETQPDQVTLIAAGREVLDVSLAKLMAEGSLAGLGPHDLALDRNELIALTRMQIGVELDEEKAERLLDETRGWITGVMLSGMLSGRAMGDLGQGARPMVYEYLASVVLNRQPDDLRRFMLDSAVLPVMSAAACDHVLQRSDSDRYLPRLVRGGLFVTATDESPRTYEYHPQFRSFLLEALQGSDPDHLRSLQIHAAGFLAESGSPEYAVDLFLNAGAVRRAAAQAEKHAREMFKAGRTQTLTLWAERLDAAGASAPRVFLYLAKAYTDQGNLEAAETALVQAFRMLEAGPSSKPVQAAAEIQRGLIALRRGRFREAQAAAGRAEQLLAGHGDPVQRAMALRLTGLAMARERGELNEAENRLRRAVRLLSRGAYPYDLATLLADLSMIQTALGKGLEAHATSVRAHEVLQDVGAPYPLATSLNNLGIDAHFQGRCMEAMELFTEAAKQARQAGSPRLEAVILFGQADLFSDMDLALQAAELYAQGLALAAKLDDTHLLRYGCVQSSVLHRRRGGVSLAHDWLRRALSLQEGGTASAAAEIQVAALEAAAGPRRARKRLQELLKDDGAGLDASERTLVGYFLARAEFAAGDLEASEGAFDEALTWAGGHGTEQVLAGEMAFDPELREFARRRLGPNPVLSVVFHRIETMRVVAQQHQEVPAEAEGVLKLELLALGQSAVQQGGRRLAELKPLAREVLFYLADRQPVERDVLLETFWPHYNPGRQISNLHTAIYTLRRFLGKEAVVQSGTAYRLGSELPIEYDVIQFERAAGVAQGLPPGDPRRLFALTAALNSYGGQFLPDCASDWVLERRRGLEMLYLDLLASHADEALVRDQPLRAISTLRQALEIDPLRDDTNLRFLEALGRLGRRSELVAHYQRYVRLLSEELGLDPPESVRQLYARLIG